MLLNDIAKIICIMFFRLGEKKYVVISTLLLIIFKVSDYKYIIKRCGYDVWRK